MGIEKYFEKEIIYRYKTGDSKVSIAQKFNTDIKNVEFLSTGEIQEGEFVRILDANNLTHIVQPMETIKKIAEIYNVSADYIIEKNKLSNTKLFVGQRLFL